MMFYVILGDGYKCRTVTDLPVVQLSDIYHTVQCILLSKIFLSFYNILKLFKSMYYCLVNSVIIIYRL